MKRRGSFSPQKARGNEKEMEDERKNNYTKHFGTEDRRD